MQSDFERIDEIINARSIAIVGASSKPGKFGSYTMGSMIAMDFDGPIYPVNPREDEIMGYSAYPDLLSVPEVPDLVYMTIPAHLSMGVLRDCAEMGVKGVVMIAAGFSEAGEEGAALEREALDIAREGGFRIVGPNCFGIYNPRNRLTLLPGYDFSRDPGDLAYISQSGGFAAHMGRLGMSLGMDFSAIVSYGNAADLDEADLLRYFARDPQTRMIGGYIEGVKDGRVFSDALCEAAEAKPVVLWKVGWSESSSRAAASHTGSLAGSAEIWDGVMRKCGAITACGIEETADVLLALKHLGRNPGRRLLIAGGGGGLGAYAADLAEAAGLEVPPMGGETLERVRVSLGRTGAVPGNPLDIGAPLIPVGEFEPTIREAAGDPGTDAMVFDLAVNFAYHLGGEEGLITAAGILIDAAREKGKPLAVALYSRACDAGALELEGILRRLRDRLHSAGVPTYPSMRRAIGAIAKVNL